MTTTRLEAFSDGVIAILITIMVLELKTPEGSDWAALRPLGTKLSAYVLSFVFIGIYWSNHHHMIQMTERVNGAILWMNLHLLFWLSLIPFGTAWVGDTKLAPVPTATYGAILLFSGVAYYLLEITIIRSQGPDSRLKEAIGSDAKGIISVVMYATAIAIAFVNPRIAEAIYLAVALMWLVPDPRIERRMRHE
jgi:TMEM175 potassium channel family protein